MDLIPGWTNASTTFVLTWLETPIPSGNIQVLHLLQYIKCHLLFDRKKIKLLLFFSNSDGSSLKGKDQTLHFHKMIQAAPPIASKLSAGS